MLQDIYMALFCIRTLQNATSINVALYYIRMLQNATRY